MRNGIGSTVVRLLGHRMAAQHGRRAGRAGLSAEEAADTPFHAALRRWLHEQQRDAAADRDRELELLEAAALESEAEARLLRGRRAAVRARAQEAMQAQRHRYEELSAVFGEAWVRWHRDRSFVRLGWRGPEVHSLEEVRDADA
jgi:hypothetical protein